MSDILVLASHPGTPDLGGRRPERDERTTARPEVPESRGVHSSANWKSGGPQQDFAGRCGWGKAVSSRERGKVAMGKGHPVMNVG